MHKSYLVGIVNPSPVIYFMVEQNHNKSIADFYSLVINGGLYLLHGLCQSGKTTSVTQICSALQSWIHLNLVYFFFFLNFFIMIRK